MSATGQVLRLHERLYEATDGRVGHRMVGVPTLLLRTTGARSGVTRTNALVYARDGADYLVVASNGGASGMAHGCGIAGCGIADLIGAGPVIGGAGGVKSTR